jgi:hypothetical protein
MKLRYLMRSLKVALQVLALMFLQPSLVLIHRYLLLIK